MHGKNIYRVRISPGNRRAVNSCYRYEERARIFKMKPRALSTGKPFPYLLVKSTSFTRIQTLVVLLESSLVFHQKDLRLHQIPSVISWRYHI